MGQGLPCTPLRCSRPTLHPTSLLQAYPAPHSPAAGLLCTPLSCRGLGVPPTDPGAGSGLPSCSLVSTPPFWGQPGGSNPSLPACLSILPLSPNVDALIYSVSFPPLALSFPCSETWRDQQAACRSRDWAGVDLEQPSGPDEAVTENKAVAEVPAQGPWKTSPRRPPAACQAPEHPR